MRGLAAIPAANLQSVPRRCRCFCSFPLLLLLLLELEDGVLVEPHPKVGRVLLIVLDCEADHLELAAI